MQRVLVLATTIAHLVVSHHVVVLVGIHVVVDVLVAVVTNVQVHVLVGA